MDDICYIDGCPGTGKFTCSCNEALRICQEHITPHFREAGLHEINAVKVNLTRINSKGAIGTLRKLNSSTLQKGKEMFKQLFEKLCDVVEDISERQELLADLSSSSYSAEVEEEIEELKAVNITLRTKEEFKELLDKFMSKEALDSSSLNDFGKDFKVIAESLEKSNKVLQLFADSHQQEQLLRVQLESRVTKLEESHGKIENLDQKITVIDSKTREHERKFETTKEQADKVNLDTKNLEKKLDTEIKLVQNMTEKRLKEIIEIEKSIKGVVKDSMDLIKSKSHQLKEDLSKIQNFSDSGFKKILDDYFNDICQRKIELIETSLKKIINDNSNSFNSKANGVSSEVGKIRDFSDSGFKKVIGNFFDEVCLRRIVENK